VRLDAAQFNIGEVELYARLGSSNAGLPSNTAAERWREVGPNTVAIGGRPTVLKDLFYRRRNPLVIQLLVIATVSYLLGDLRSTLVVGAPNRAWVLAQNSDLVARLERDNGLAQRLAASAPFAVADCQVFITGATAYAGGRTLYQCVALLPPA